MYLLMRIERAREPLRDCLRGEPKERTLTGLGVVVHENVGDTDALHPDRKAQIRHPLYDRRPVAACERVFFQRKNQLMVPGQLAQERFVDRLGKPGVDHRREPVGSGQTRR